ncbi:MAG: formylglycine-generating enzyme family protein [Bacteroidales bacterium]|nr:formylglycine-generating enzyme family protein [Bacteroidales bacterium]
MVEKSMVGAARLLISCLLWVGVVVLVACNGEEPNTKPQTPPAVGPHTVNYKAGPAHDTVFEAEGIRFYMKYVEGGTFRMGASTDEADANYDVNADPVAEMPTHFVRLDGFLLGELEVSQALMLAVYGLNPSHDVNLTFPAQNISYTTAERFLDSLRAATGFAFRMPTEAEWEYAARGGQPGIAAHHSYSGHDDVDSVAWHQGNSEGMPHPVGHLLPNVLGIYDMSGNVAEWCTDWYAVYPSSPQSNPQGPAQPATPNHAWHVVRGGGYNRPAFYQRVSARQYQYGSYEADEMGLRLALSVRQ